MPRSGSLTWIGTPRVPTQKRKTVPRPFQLDDYPIRNYSPSLSTLPAQTGSGNARAQHPHDFGMTDVYRNASLSSLLQPGCGAPSGNFFHIRIVCILYDHQL